MRTGRLFSPRPSGTVPFGSSVTTPELALTPRSAPGIWGLRMIQKVAATLLLACVTMGSIGCIGATAVVSVVQPTNVGGIPVLVLTTFAEDGTSNDRVLARIERDGQLFVSANHWIRPWYHRALANPEVQVTIDGHKADYLALPVTDEERDRLLSTSEVPFVLRVLFGFPPRQFLRLDPR